MQVHTLGIWRVRPGEESEFVAAWREMAERTKIEFPSATAVLLRDEEDPSMFVSTGPWESRGAVDVWRASSAFTEGVARIRESLVSFEAHTMTPVVTVEVQQRPTVGGATLPGP